MTGSRLSGRWRRSAVPAAGEQQLEGIVAKRLDSRYEPGKRGRTWLKIKHSRRQELVIGGWLPGAGRRTNQIGALLVGFDEAGPDGASSPFTGRQPQRGAQFAEPELVAEIEFNEWTSQLMLRHPSYKGLRTDKDAHDVVLEEPERT